MTVIGTRFRKTLDIFGKFLLGWFVFSTLLYFWSGGFFTELENIPMSVSTGSYWWAIHGIILVFSAGFAVFLLIPLLLRGYWSGLFIAILYWLFGNYVNPFWYMFPQEWQASERDGASGFLYVINILWSLAMLFGILALFITKRPSTKTLTPS
jgi:hypothetical protein